ncbi:TraR/DksA C4-type zinc finger protein [Thaumasiovibrio sp. DFM-14]|uniref:TraR/DksA C4-type zinc finger protein n=1 Tax=Thaumasiovibrio sp. DFM-14 TaxID=3384792 RepID=UPI0039A05781
MNTLITLHDQLLHRINSELDSLTLELITVLCHESDLLKPELTQQERSKLIDLGKSSLHKTTRDMARRIERLDAAICADRIGMYGTCTDCEDTIALYDLEIDPAEPRCFECRQKLSH